MYRIWWSMDTLAVVCRLQLRWLHQAWSSQSAVDSSFTNSFCSSPFTLSRLYRWATSSCSWVVSRRSATLSKFSYLFLLATVSTNIDAGLKLASDILSGINHSSNANSSICESHASAQATKRCIPPPAHRPGAIRCKFRPSQFCAERQKFVLNSFSQATN